MRCLLIDVGSTFIKYATYDTIADTVCHSDKVAFPTALVDDGVRFHVSAEAIADCVRSICQDGAHNGCSRVYLSVQMHGYVLRYPDGTLSPYVSWRDRSGDPTDARLDAVDLNACGTARKPNLPLAKLLAHPVEAEFFTLGSYLAFSLTGVNATHLTDACPSGLFYADSGKPNGACPWLTLPRVCTEIRAVGMHGGMQVYAPIGDHQISYLGSGAAQQAVLVNVGTATQISCVGEATHPDGAYEKRPYFSRNERLYTVSGLLGGAALYRDRRYEELFDEIMHALGALPTRRHVLLGGGGAPQVYDTLQARFAEKGIACTLIQKNIGTEGLIMIAKQHKTKVGTMLSELAWANFPVVAQKSGLDFMIIDNEHGYFDYPSIAALTMNANLIGMESIIRIGDASRGHITKLADIGAHGFLLPMTNTPSDIQTVIDYAMYCPVGKRGVSTTRAHTLYDPPKLTDYMAIANEKMKIYAQIETKQGLDNVDEILALPAVTGVLIGPNDLSVDLNCIGSKPPILSAIRRVADAARKAGKVWGIITADKELLTCAKECGVDLVSIGSELNMLLNGCKKLRTDLEAL